MRIWGVTRWGSGLVGVLVVVGDFLCMGCESVL